MKALITAIGVGGLLITPLGAYATNFTWDAGAANNRWHTDGNWNSSGAPGDSATDTALIDAFPSAQPDYVAGSGDRTIADLTLNSETNSVAVLLDIIGDDEFTVTGTTSVVADSDGSNNAAITLSASQDMVFDPGAFVLDGGDPDETNRGQALFDFDAGTLVAPDTLTMRGDSMVDAEENITLDASVDGTLTVDAGSFRTEAIIDMLSGKTFTAGSVVIGDDTYGCKLTFSGSGSLTTN
jgi:hypothetical protein